MLNILSKVNGTLEIDQTFTEQLIILVIHRTKTTFTENLRLEESVNTPTTRLEIVFLCHHWETRPTNTQLTVEDFIMNQGSTQGPQTLTEKEIELKLTWLILQFPRMPNIHSIQP